MPNPLQRGCGSQAFCSALAQRIATGVQVFTPDGDLLGESIAPRVTNFTFGGPDNDVLFILGNTVIWQAKLAVAGVLTS
jgi:gluconolactonase